MAEETKVKRKRIAATGMMKKIMADYFYEMDKAVKAGAPKVAWCTSVGPGELLRAMGFLVHFPENHGAMLGATRTANDYIPLANAIGYSPDICSYLTSDVGAYLKGETPLSKAYPGIENVPKPDVLVFNTNQCRDVQDWFGWYSREFKVPIMGINTHRGVREVTKSHIDSVARQIASLVPGLEEISGNKFDLERLQETVDLSLECSQLWRRVLETAANVPSPFTFFDGTIHMGPAVVLRGTKTAVDYYKALLAELNDRVDKGVAAVEGERYRLYWEGMPIWGRLRDLSEFFAHLKASVLASTYCNSWIFDAFDPKEPFGSMAKAYTLLFIVRSDEEKEKYIEDMVTKFKLDGIVFHDSKTCPNNTNSRYGMPERLRESLDVNTVTIFGDLNDLRCYSEEQSKTNIEAFIEQLERK
ncbi:2-hydroxyacyl-CoA dehydratase [candidate division TA06 bacterium]|uniref:2-hydroxyacyl-CoA dehydratase n=1 Tax=candidate division TA06 bacterium TaxID=2250710 RepID=A0A523XKB8_UNCT6|nr:MAG: 2-hydroxyacyl-CoA dehydratase [candidate division TA06 bacterium]